MSMPEQIKMLAVLRDRLHGAADFLDLARHVKDFRLIDADELNTTITKIRGWADACDGRGARLEKEAK
jgi:hypothetical protein